MTDRAGVLVQHYEYAAFGNERFNNGTPGFQCDFARFVWYSGVSIHRVHTDFRDEPSHIP